MGKFYNLEDNGKTADLFLYDEIGGWGDSDLSVINQLNSLEAEEINVHINSYGGDVKDGLGIYAALKNHKAKVTTYCDGFACSIASVIFMAGDERVMENHSLLMIHNPWSMTCGNAEELREQADVLDQLAESIRQAYLSKITIEEDELKELMDSESWLSADEAVDKGFATKINKESTDDSAKAKVLSAFFNAFIKPKNEEPTDPEDPEESNELEQRVDELTARLDELTNRVEELEKEEKPDEPEEPTEPENKTNNLFKNFMKGKKNND